MLVAERLLHVLLITVHICIFLALCIECLKQSSVQTCHISDRHVLAILIVSACKCRVSSYDSVLALRVSQSLLKFYFSPELLRL